MKLLIILLVLSSSIATAADFKCTVISKKDPELASGVNKDSICNESYYALKNDLGRISKKLKIRVVGRSTNSVSLVIKNTDESNMNYINYGELIWYPGDEYVILKH